MYTKNNVHWFKIVLSDLKLEASAYPDHLVLIPVGHQILEAAFSLSLNNFREVLVEGIRIKKVSMSHTVKDIIGNVLLVQPLPIHDGRKGSGRLQLMKHLQLFPRTSVLQGEG